MNQKLVLVLGVLMVASVAFAQQNPAGQGPTLLNGGLTGTPGGFTGSGPNNQGGPGLGRHDLVDFTNGNYLGCETCHLPHTAPTYGNSFLWAWRNLPTDLPTYETPTNKGGALVTPPTYPGGTSGVPTGNTRSMLCFSCHDATSASANGIVAQNTYNGLPYPLLTTSGGVSYGLQTEHPVDALFPSTSDYVQPVLVGTVGCNAVFSAIACVGVDQLPLWYQGSPVTASPGVECGTCHDPHNDYTSNGGPGAGGIPFLRQSNVNGTYLCRECHNAQ
jgi:hypothetical protein